ncbi:MAG: twitching motility protein PilT [Bacteroidetes bacterium GWF2_33_16]|nr:MAG: twitching motility protein PilT [Bacteroidetes bacterium GWE2_32_14]OFY08765.1 MAG: twitching motility protein PilT [Bacteroidetes bacterium GWF2_33_16]
MGLYVIDSIFFIQAHRDIYPLDVAFSFWNKIKQLAGEGKIVSIDKVKDELYDKNDALEAWCRNNLPEDFFKDTSGIMIEYGQVTSWAVSKSSHYLPAAINEFLSADEADAFIIAYVLNDKNNRTLVTQETSEPNRKSKIKIPEPCNEFSIRYIKTMEIFRELGVTF